MCIHRFNYLLWVLNRHNNNSNSNNSRVISHPHQLPPLLPLHPPPRSHLQNSPYIHTTPSSHSSPHSPLINSHTPLKPSYCYCSWVSQPRTSSPTFFREWSSCYWHTSHECLMCYTNPQLLWLLHLLLCLHPLPHNHQSTLNEGPVSTHHHPPHPRPQPPHHPVPPPSNSPPTPH